MSRLDTIIEGVLAGDPGALGQAVRMVDDGLPGNEDVIARLHPVGGESRVVGITGPPGAGKSTIISGLLGEARSRGLRAAVLAVDPTSPYSGGAVLGDRVRMQDHAADPGVFIRSLATRDHTGGLARPVQDLVILLEAARFDIIILETVGVGQEEVEVRDLAQTVVFTTVPGLGDDVQAMKAGVLEIAHIHVVNKADKPMSEEAVKDLKAMIGMSENKDGSGWTPPVLTSVATKGTGIRDIMEELDRHYSHLRSTGGLDAWRRTVAAGAVKRALVGMVCDSVERSLANDQDAFDKDVRRVSRREEDPRSVAMKWLQKLNLGRNRDRAYLERMAPFHGKSDE